MISWVKLTLRSVFCGWFQERFGPKLRLLYVCKQSNPNGWSKADFHFGRVLADVRQRFSQCATWEEDDLLKSINIAAGKNLLAAAFFHGLCVVASEFLLFAVLLRIQDLSECVCSYCIRKCEAQEGFLMSSDLSCSHGGQVLLDS